MIEIVRVQCPHRIGLAYREGGTMGLLPCDCNEPSDVLEVAGVALEHFESLRHERNEWRQLAVERRPK